MDEGREEDADPVIGSLSKTPLGKVKATEVSGQGNTEHGVTQNSRSIAEISIAQ
jgi:hypothetical protein